MSKKPKADDLGVCEATLLEQRVCALEERLERVQSLVDEYFADNDNNFADANDWMIAIAKAVGRAPWG